MRRQGLQSAKAQSRGEAKAFASRSPTGRTPAPEKKRFSVSACGREAYCAPRSRSEALIAHGRARVDGLKKGGSRICTSTCDLARTAIDLRAGSRPHDTVARAARETDDKIAIDHGDLHRRQPHARGALTLSRVDIELVAVPGTNDVGVI